MLAFMNCSSRGFFVTRFTEPPVEPRPVYVEPGPLITSICSSANTSRVCEPASRTPSMNTSEPASKPRIFKLSPAGCPPSPALNVMPGTVRSASTSEVEPVSAISACEITVTDFGVSISGAVNLLDVGSGGVASPVTTTSACGPRCCANAAVEVSARATALATNPRAGSSRA